MENIYQQAIADAKALRASAMANAKSALQEAFEPKITEMVRLKLSEELQDEVELEEEEVELEEMQDYEQGLEEGDETIDESNLDEILAELEQLANEGSDNLEEAEEAEEEKTEDEEEEGDEESEEGEESEEEDIVDDETKVIDITLGDLKRVFQSLQAQEETPEMDATEMDAIDLGAEEGEAALDAEENMEETFSLDEILAELENEGKDEIHEKKEKKEDDKEKAEMKKELNEAKKAIKQLQESFTEVNLLNAKLLYMNKLFKAKNLSESEKIRVVKAFDRASSVKEVKNTFDVLKESIETKKKSQIQESFGYASKPAGMSPSNNVIESDPFVSRWQKIAGL
jgi:hypothetical protein